MKLHDLKKQWDALKLKRNLTGAGALTAVQRDGYALQYVAESKQTEAVCLAAVQQNGDALRYVAESKQTEAVCLAAVQQDGHALQYVAESAFKAAESEEK